MNIQSSMPRLKGFRYPLEVIAYAVWAYYRFALSTADVEDLLAERGVAVSRETIRLWVNRFGAHFAACIRRDRPKPNDKWHMDEVASRSAARSTGCGEPSTRTATFSIFSFKRSEMQSRPSGFSKD